MSLESGEKLFNLLIKVKEIKGFCPVYKEGDSFMTFEGYKLKAEKPICMHSLSAIMPYYVALSRKISPKELGLAKKDGDIAYTQCLDPCEYTDWGTVTFEIKTTLKLT